MSYSFSSSACTIGMAMASPTMGTLMTLELADFVSETVPEDDVKSPGADADPDAVAQPTWRVQHTFGGGAAWIVNDAVAGTAPVPSVTVTSEMVTEGVGAAAQLP